MTHLDNGIETFTGYKKSKLGYIGVYGLFTPAGKIRYESNIERLTIKDALLDAENNRQELLNSTFNLIT